MDPSKLFVLWVDKTISAPPSSQGTDHTITPTSSPGTNHVIVMMAGMSVISLTATTGTAATVVSAAAAVTVGAVAESVAAVIHVLFMTRELL